MTELYEGRGTDRATAPPSNPAPWVAVAVLAILAGVGTATMGEPDRPESGRSVDSRAARVRGISPRMVELTFNPRTARGLKIAKVAFRFTFEYQASDRETIRTRFDSGWNPMVSRVLRVLMGKTSDQLKAEGGLDDVERDIRAAIDGSMFVDGIARACEIQWEQILVQ